MGKEKKDMTAKILKKRDAIKDDNTNANKLLEILKLSQSKHEDVVVTCCQALGDIMAHFMSEHQFLDPSKNAVAEEDLNKEGQFSSWLKVQFTTTCDILCEHLGHESEEVQAAALGAVIAILESGREFSVLSTYGNLSERMMSHLLSNMKAQADLIGQLPVTLSQGEGHTTEITQACLGQVKKSFKQQAQPSDVFLINCWHVLKNISSLEMDDKSKRMLTGAVCDFLKLKLPSSLYRDILTGLSAVMDKMSSPIRLADFLSESFNIGGAISLLSLHGLFILMHKYNLDYPDFYNKLYSMFEPQVFSAKYRARFFHLAETFLSSTHLPAYLVAAFAKRLARLALHAPMPGSHIAVPFILNLLHRHPACEVLLHRPGECKDVDSDPFLPEENDTSKCKAVDSCLWELQALEHHYDPSLSLQAKKRHVAERDLGSVLDNSYTEIFTSEAKKVKSDVEVTFVKPSGLELPEFFVL